MDRVLPATDIRSRPAPAPRAPIADSDLLAALCGLTAQQWRGISHRAGLLGADPFDLALGEGLVAEDTFLTALARLSGARYAPVPPPAERGSPEAAFALRLYRAETTGDRVVQPNGAVALALIRQHRERRGGPIRLAGRQAFLEALVAANARRIARRALTTLPARHSARPAEEAPRPRGWRNLLGALGLLLAFLALAAIFPVEAMILPPLLLSPIFVLAGIAALTATVESAMPRRAPPQLESQRLPRYSILVPLYREANIVPALVARLGALIYPRDRLEVFFLVEADDHETRVALHAAALPPGFLIFPVPDGTPRTKPRALNAALPFTTGDLLVVYDAEDAPEPDQLLRAAAMFEACPANVACVQARLAILNARDGFLARRFAIDYAALFDCVKAGSARAGWSVPLGGSSNHFRTGVLKQIGAWDAWNVTEDADLGLRLARFGWLVEDLRSTTWEEAPNRVRDWFGQRRRWLKGWLQTLLVQVRDPAGLVAGLGLFRALVIAATGFGVLAGAMLSPLFILAIGVRLAFGGPLGSGGMLILLADSMLILTLAIAALVEIVPAFIALRRRRALFLAPWILLAPATHAMVTLAAWQALWELIRRPYHWQKTEHGRARQAGGLASIDGAGAAPASIEPATRR